MCCATAALFGVGHFIASLGVLTTFFEALAPLWKSGALQQYWRTSGSVPVTVVVGFLFLLIAYFHHLCLGLTIIWSAKRASSKVNVNVVAPPLYAFSNMNLFAGVGLLLVLGTPGQPSSFSLSLSLLIIAPLLLVIGYEVCRRLPSRTHVGGFLMATSSILLYFGAYAPVFNMAKEAGLSLGGPLFSRFEFEAAALAMAASSAIIHPLEGLSTRAKRKIVGAILCLSGVTFSVGAIMFSFSAASSVNKLMSLLSALQGLASPFQGVPVSGLYGLQMIFAGFIVAGIAAIFILLTSCLGAILTVREGGVSVVEERRETAPAVFCVYCGAGNPHAAVYCWKCGRKLVKPGEEKQPV